MSHETPDFADHCDARWFMTIPPVGAARMVALQLAAAFKDVAPLRAPKLFDFGASGEALKRMLNPTGLSLLPDFQNHMLIVQCLDYHATHLLVPALCPVPLHTLRLLRHYGVRTLHWFIEDYRQAIYWKDVVAGYEWFFAMQDSPLREYCQSQGTKFECIATAGLEPEIEPELKAEQRPADVAFVGIPTPYRIEVLEYLASRGIRLAVGGHGWNRYVGPLRSSVRAGSWIEGPQLSALLYSARIGLNLSQTDPEENREATQISPRVFDIALHGLPLITEAVPLLRATAPGIAAVQFSSKEDAAVKIGDMLERYDGELVRAEQNRQTAVARHRYRNRVEQMLAMVC
jgi:hypothetical protein